MNNDILRQYALQFINTPYRFGGKNPMTGLDCSGLVSELLKAAGVMPEHADLNAQGIFDLYSQDGKWNDFRMGSLVFYGADSKNIDHVAVLVDDKTIMAANSGDHTTVDLETAERQNAFVKLRPIDWRKDRIAVIRPRFSFDL
jgi:cell wall-associated NlpC family hydrolase